MRLLPYVVCLTSLSGPALPSNAWAQQRSLAGFQYIHVVLPTYQGNQTDIFGFGAFLLEQLQKDRSWIVIPNLKDVEGDRQKMSKTVICTLGHDNKGAQLRLFDVVGNALRSFESSGTSFTSGMNAAYAPWAVDQKDDIRSNIKGALKKLRKARSRFDAKQAVDIMALFKNVERVDLSEQRFDQYLSENRAELSPVEGVWAEQEGQYRIGIMRKAQGFNQFVAFVLASRNALWDPGMVKATLSGTAYETAFVARFFMGDHTEVGSAAKLDGGLLSFPVRHREKEEIVNFIRIRPTESGPVTGYRGPEGDSQLVSTGTGFMCRTDLIATNYHVIRGGSRWEVSFPSTRESFGLELVLSDKANDLAILRLVPKQGVRLSITPLTIIDSTTARMGEELYTIGFPLGDLLGSGHKVATGVLSGTAGLEDDPRMFQITVPIQPGNSGGPIFNEKGELVGVLASTLSVEYLYKKQGHIPQNVNFAIKSDYLAMLLRQAPGAPATAHLDLATMVRADQVARVKNSVGQIKTYK